MKKPVKHYLKLTAILAISVCSNFNCSSTEGFIQTVDSVKNIYIVNIDAKTTTNKNPLSLELKAGNYTISVIGINEGGQYNAWKPWFKLYRVKTNKNGEWIKGWINKYSFSSTEFPEVTIQDNIIYETPETALDNATDSKFTLVKKTFVQFYINDSPYIDNSGGISLYIVRTGDPAL